MSKLYDYLGEGGAGFNKINSTQNAHPQSCSWDFSLQALYRRKGGESLQCWVPCYVCLLILLIDLCVSLFIHLFAGVGSNVYPRGEPKHFSLFYIVMLDSNITMKLLSVLEGMNVCTNHSSFIKCVCAYICLFARMKCIMFEIRSKHGQRIKNLFQKKKKKKKKDVRKEISLVGWWLLPFRLVF